MTVNDIPSKTITSTKNTPTTGTTVTMTMQDLKRAVAEGRITLTADGEVRPGRELDALVAEAALGWQWFTYPDRMTRYFRQSENFVYGAIAEGDAVEYTNQLPPISTDTGVAWEHLAMPVIRSGGSAWMEADGHTGFRAGVTLPVRAEAESDYGVAHALCLAVLKARGVEVPS